MAKLKFRVHYDNFLHHSEPTIWLLIDKYATCRYHFTLACSIYANIQTLTVRRQQEVRGVGPPQPSDLVDLLLDLQRLEVVKLGLVGLKLGEVAVLHGGNAWSAPGAHRIL